MIDITDLFAEELNGEITIKESKNILLRFNTEMKRWYKAIVSTQPDEYENTYALTSKYFWKFLHECKILNHKACLAAINRIIIRSSKILYPLSTNRVTLRTKIQYYKSN